MRFSTPKNATPRTLFFVIVTNVIGLCSFIHCSLIYSTPASAVGLGAGYSQVEEGDDRMRPALSLFLNYNPQFHGAAHIYGREFGPITERSIIINGCYRLSKIMIDGLYASIGVALLADQTTVDYGDDTAGNDSSTEFNAGAVFLLEYRYPLTAGLVTHLNWQSHVFPAGVQGGIFLSSGRRQTLTLAIDYDI